MSVLIESLAVSVKYGTMETLAEVNRCSIIKTNTDRGFPLQ